MIYKYKVCLETVMDRANKFAVCGVLWNSTGLTSFSDMTKKKLRSNLILFIDTCRYGNGVDYNKFGRKNKNKFLS